MMRPKLVKRPKSLFSDVLLQKMRTPIEVRVVKFVEAPTWVSFGNYFYMVQDFHRIDLQRICQLMDKRNDIFLHLRICEGNELLILKNIEDDTYSLEQFCNQGPGWFPILEVFIDFHTQHDSLNISSPFIEELIYLIETDQINYLLYPEDEDFTMDYYLKPDYLLKGYYPDDDDDDDNDDDDPYGGGGYGCKTQYNQNSLVFIGSTQLSVS